MRARHTCPSMCCCPDTLTCSGKSDVQFGLTWFFTALNLMTSWEPPPGAAMLVVCSHMHQSVSASLCGMLVFEAWVPSTHAGRP